MQKQTFLITGAANRIGAAMAEGLAKDGHQVVIHYNRSDDEAAKLAEKLNAQGCKTAIEGADLTDAGQYDTLVERAAKHFGPLTGLINNASLFKPDNIDDLTHELWHKHFSVHAEATMFLAKHFAAQLPDDQQGLIVNMIDQRVWALKPSFFSYTLSKSVLWTATQTLAQALAPRIRVNAIGPGPTLQNEHQTEADFEDELKSLPLKTGPALDEIVDTVRYFLNAKSVTGQMIAMDGGQHLMWTDIGETN
ncbi:SDR family oxidoreductase [Maritalea mediterranea]|uniref:SDR family oxidoreductase n=1 Tax=Maritalea mediterranea TaxID=2909667 RepID=A0ABS9E848_9HYPH|nr:SDR family oxidoreductase [Maritalea mediterranea]MCF4099049.1 SDR family oxidoreductase [Maritalea mediterranea]